MAFLDKIKDVLYDDAGSAVGGYTPKGSMGLLTRLGLAAQEHSRPGATMDYLQGFELAKKEQDEQLRKESQLAKFAELANLKDPQAILQGQAALDPQYLDELANYYKEQNKPKLPQTTGLPEGYMWQGDKAVRINGVPEPKPTPQSPEGKFEADFRNGLISEDAYLAAKQKPDKAKDFKEYQLKSSSFANRMVSSDSLFSDVEKQITESGGELVNTGAEAALTAIPTMFGGKTLANNLRSPEQQQYRNAANEWIRAKLRKESGAVIGEDEMDEEYRTYFPVVGDSPEVIKQKEKLRATATDSMIKESGGAYDSLYKQEAKQDLTKVSDEELLKLLGN